MKSLKKLYIASVLSLISPVSLLCMKLTTIKLPGKKIEKRNKEIKTKSVEILRNFYQNKDIADPSADIAVINERRALMQENIDNKYKAVFMSIQQMYNIDFDFYTYFQNIDKYITITNKQKENISSETPTQQEVRRSYFLSRLKKRLRRSDFGESLVTFTENNMRSHSVPPIFSSCIEDDLLHIHVDQPGCININPKTVTDLSVNAQRGGCIALVNQFQHVTAAALLYHMVNAMTKKNVDEKQFYKLVHPNQSLSLLSFALNNARATRLLLNFYVEDKDLLFTVTDHNKLCKINTLHAALAWLKEYELYNKKPAIKNTPVSKYIICKSCLGKRIDNKNPDYPGLCSDCCSANYNVLGILGIL